MTAQSSAAAWVTMLLLQILQVTWHCLMYCNSCVNPFIYNYTSKDFRDGFRDVVSRWRLASNAGTTAVTSGGQRCVTLYVSHSRPRGRYSDSVGIIAGLQRLLTLLTN